MSIDLRNFYATCLEIKLVCMKIILKEVDIGVTIELVMVEEGDINIEIAIVK